MRSLPRHTSSGRRAAEPGFLAATFAPVFLAVLLTATFAPVFLAVLLAAPATLAAQDRPGGDTTFRSGASADTAAFRLIGQVRDLSTRLPIPMAVVELPGRDLLRVADDSGYFAFDGLKPGRYPLVAQAIGYASTFDTMTVHAGQGALVWLKPRPVLLPEVGVVVRRQSYVAELNESVTATGLSAAIVGPEELSHSPVQSLFTVLQAKSPVRFALCPGQSMAHTSPGPVGSFKPAVNEMEDLGVSPACVRYRGSLVRVRVFYNDARVPPSSMLSESPRDFYLVQLIPSLRLLRLYTYDYIEALAKRGWKPQPICTVCDQ